MIKPRIIVTGATGKTGSVVVSELLKAGCPVRALVHKEDGRSAHLKAQGAELAVAELSDVGKLDSGAIALARQPLDVFGLVADVAEHVHEAKDREVGGLSCGLPATVS